MPEPGFTFHADEEVSARVIGVITKAEKYVVLVSPYLDLWDHLRNAIKLAVKRGIDVRLVIRNDPQVVGSNDTRELMIAGAKVYAVGNLHAKIYMNERQVVVSSMNLTQSSARNSLEYALVLADDNGAAEVRRYVTKTVIPLAVQLTSASQAWSRPVSGTATSTGFCIRCGSEWLYDPARPLCDDCYDVWAEWENPDYPERVCHRCGEGAEVSYARSLCPRCYRSR